MEPRTCHPSGDRRLNAVTVALTGFALHWQESNSTPGTNYFPEKKWGGHACLTVQCLSHWIGTRRRVWGLTCLAVLFLPGPDSSLDLHPKSFHPFPSLFFFISLNPIFHMFPDFTFVLIAVAQPSFSDETTGPLCWDGNGLFSLPGPRGGEDPGGGGPYFL